ncbi:MAG: YraN family protein [Candidatus Sungbacteria bacterium]|nr:YraN family protein [Candidatus Sungbacteria bacterium]
MTLTNSQIGQTGEDAAVEHLKSNGYSIVSRNYEMPMGEIDIVVKSGRRYRFVEVKTSLDTYRDTFSPEERVDKRKRRRLQGLCETYLLREGIGLDVEWQVDIIAVTLDSEGKVKHIEHIENAVWDQRGV